MRWVSAALQAGILGALAAWLTNSFTNPLNQAWMAKDYVFVVAVVVAVFYNRMSTMKYEHLMQEEHGKKLQDASPLRQIELIQGLPVQLELNKVTCMLFFGTWCKHSRAALKEFERLRRVVTHAAVQFIALTQESREELKMYSIKGRTASDFQELKEFTFSIAIEDGLMGKEYLVKYDAMKVPYLFIIAKNKRVFWYGDPKTTGIEEIIRSALSEENVTVDSGDKSEAKKEN